ncbi:hypothetical protein [Endozoicomonas sp. YOMI1]|uniref:hypothetical protein n=1 Tax=Endozoicomonas sp. YOMI1 TaxID=2828739 RepID=UPI0021482760|nr:hypothetical protein [Endozoicomonas sp. YOMI1]
MNTDQITNLQQPAYINLPENNKFSGCVEVGNSVYIYEPKDPKDPTNGIRVKVNAFSKSVTSGYLNGHTHIKKPASQLLLWLYGYKTLPSNTLFFLLPLVTPSIDEETIKFATGYSTLLIMLTLIQGNHEQESSSY